MKKIGKVGKRNQQALHTLTALYQEEGIYSCEAKLPGCMGQMFTGFAHRHKRHWYYPVDKWELLEDINQTILCCQVCHDQIENNKDLTRQVFDRLRGPEKL